MMKPNRKPDGGRFSDEIWQQRISDLSPSRQRMFYATLALVEFVVASVLRIYLYFRYPGFLYVWFAINISILLTFAKRRSKNMYYLPCGICMLFGLVAGMVCGMLNYYYYFIVADFYDNGQVYRNVVATEKASAYVDASQMSFASGTYVDVSRSVGYKYKGTTYCAAPVTEQGQATADQVVQFWAVGTDCCESAGSFACDDVATADVHSAAVLLDYDHLLYAGTIDVFRKAVEKVRGMYQLPDNRDYMVVRWMKDPSALRAEYVGKSIALFFISIAAFWIVAFIFAYTVTRILSTMVGGMVAPKPQKTYGTQTGRGVF